MLPNLPRLRRKVHRDGSVSYWYDRGGKPRRWEPLGKSEAIALRKYEELVNAPKPAPGSVDRMLEDCIVGMERGEILTRDNTPVSRGTLGNYRGYRKHLAAVFVDPPETITQAQVLRYLRLCPRMTFRNEIGLLSLAFVNWMDQGRLDFNPCFGVKIKRKGSKRTRLLPWAEIDAIIAKADERLAIAIELDLAVGLRIGDLCALRWKDVESYLDTAKTDRRLAWERTESLDSLLARARALQARVASLYVLCQRGGKRWTTGALRDRWDRAVKAAGVEDAVFHDLRAAAATEVERLYGRKAAQLYLGHKSELTTETYLRDLRILTVRPLERRKA